MKNIILWSILLSLNSVCFADLLDEEDDSIVDERPVVNKQEVLPHKNNKLKSSKKTRQIKTKKDKNANRKSLKRSKQNVLVPKKANKKPTNKKRDLTVKWRSKGMRAMREKGKIELLDDVFISQDELNMKADKAVVLMNQIDNKVKVINANGRVEINGVDSSTGEKIKAFANKIIFHNQKRIITLLGNARLWRGTDQTLRGNKIIYELDTGWIRADDVSGEMDSLE